MLLSPFHWPLLLVPIRSISSAPLMSVYSTMDAAIMFHWLLLLVPTRSISSAPLTYVYSTMDAAVDAAITFSLTTTSSPYKVNKFCTSVVCLFNNGCCNGCYYQFFIESSASVDNDIHFVMISDILIESSAPVWMINNHIHPVTISYLLIESSAPVWIIDNDIHLVMILDAFIESSVCMIVNDIQLVMI